VENITTTPSSGSTGGQSAGDPMRRVQIDGNMVLDDDTSGNTSSKLSSGGFIGDLDRHRSGQLGHQQQF